MCASCAVCNSAASRERTRAGISLHLVVFFFALLMGSIETRVPVRRLVFRSVFCIINRALIRPRSLLSPVLCAHVCISARIAHEHRVMREGDEKKRAVANSDPDN